LKIRIKDIGSAIIAILIFIFLGFLIRKITLDFFTVHHHSNVRPVVMCSFLSKIDYISLWVAQYINSNNFIPEGEFGCLSALEFFRDQENITGLDDNLLDYLQRQITSSDDVDLPVIMANIILEYAKKNDDVNRYYNFNNNELLSFEIGTNQSATNNSDDYKYLYLIFSLENFSLDNQSYAKVLISMRDGYYFQDTKGTPYEEGIKVMVRFRL
jgi:hypothetical protein